MTSWRLWTVLIAATVISGCADEDVIDESHADAADDGESDSAATDTGPRDAAPDARPDLGPLDTGASDGSTIDSAKTDTGSPDAGPDVVDASDADGASPDSALDSSVADATPDAPSDVAPPPTPVVSTTTPLDGRVGVGTADTVKVTFSLVMQTATLTAQATTGACSGSFQLLVGPAFTSCVGGTLASTDGQTFTFTPAAALSNETRYRVHVTTAAVAVDGQPMASYTMSPGFFTTRFAGDARILYMSTATNAAFGGAAGGDVLCTTMAARPVGVTSAKAMVTDATRTACTVSNCGTGNVQTNWVLHPTTNYVRADGLFVFTTDGNGIFTAYPGAHDLGSGVNFWDGINSDWTSLGPNCTEWTSSVAASTGRVGFDSGFPSGSWMLGGVLGCNLARPIVCAEQ